MIELRDVEVYYYGEKVYDLNIVVPDGRTLILAPCGNGKTTLFRIICGLKEIKDGFVFIDGKDVSFNRPRQEISLWFASSRFLRAIKKSATFWLFR